MSFLVKPAKEFKKNATVGNQVTNGAESSLKPGVCPRYNLCRMRAV